MPIKTLLFAAGFLLCAGGAVFDPIFGMIGYMLHYNIGPERQWWHAPLRPLGIRYSFILGLLTAVGIAVNWRRMREGFRGVLVGHEKLMLLFLGIVWLSVLIGEETVGRYTTVDHPSVKLTKLILATLMMTHIATRIRRLDALLWVTIISALILGLQAYTTPRRAFTHGRLESIGGAGFTSANGLGAYLAAVMPIIGVMFMRSRWPAKFLCAAAGVFAMNAIVLTRSRSATVALGIGALVMASGAPRRYRARIIVGLLVAGLGFLYLSDPQFIDRAKTIFGSQGELDASNEVRVELWRQGIRIIRDKPWGIGAGNFHQAIARRAPDLPARDAHNTYIRCGAELGLHGLAVWLAIIANALLVLRRGARRAVEMADEPRKHVQWTAIALGASVLSLSAFGLTGTLLYFEAFWWLLAMPVCLQRALDNARSDMPTSLAEKPLTSSA